MNSPNPDALNNLPPLRDVIAAARLRAEKKFGQNFLLDLNITRKIVRLAHLPENAHVVEIGPGPGGLTRALLETGARVDAYELDPRVLPVLEQLKEASDGRLDVHMKDALSVDWSVVPERTYIVANLPYNIATPLLFKWLETFYVRPQSIGGMALMFQAEVADRICASPGNKEYGRLSVMAQWLMDVRPIVTLPPSAFTPAPKVHSTIVRFTPRTPFLPASYSMMERIVANAFNQRRKMIRSSLSGHNFDWEALGIDSEKRAENLTVEDYVRLSNAVST